MDADLDTLAAALYVRTAFPWLLDGNVQVVDVPTVIGQRILLSTRSAVNDG